MPELEFLDNLLAGLRSLLPRETPSTVDGILLAVAYLKGQAEGSKYRAPGDPVPMRLTCPECSVLHIDEGEFATKPHHTHACQHCGNVWRPAIVPTVGVRFLPGFKSEPSKFRCDFNFSTGKPCVSPTCHIDGKHYTEGVVP